MTLFLHLGLALSSLDHSLLPALTFCLDAANSLLPALTFCLDADYYFLPTLTFCLDADFYLLPVLTLCLDMGCSLIAACLGTDCSLIATFPDSCLNNGMRKYLLPVETSACLVPCSHQRRLFLHTPATLNSTILKPSDTVRYTLSLGRCGTSQCCKYKSLPWAFYYW